MWKINNLDKNFVSRYGKNDIVTTTKYHWDRSIYKTFLLFCLHSLSLLITFNVYSHQFIIRLNCDHFVRRMFRFEMWNEVVKCLSVCITVRAVSHLLVFFFSVSAHFWSSYLTFRTSSPLNLLFLSHTDGLGSYPHYRGYKASLSTEMFIKDIPVSSRGIKMALLRSWKSFPDFSESTENDMSLLWYLGLP